MPDYEYEDLVGGQAPPSNPLGELNKTLDLLNQLTRPAPAQSPDAQVGNDLLTPPGVRIPDRLASEGLSTGANVPQPSGNERPAEYTPRVSMQMEQALNPNDYGTEYAAKSVDEATRAQNDQLGRVAATREEYMRAKQAAEREHATQQATALEDSAEEQLLLNQKHERTMEMVNARADAETASMLTNLADLAKQEPNPGRWWENMGGLGKALWGLGLVFGAAHTAITPGAKNAALEMVRQEIANDVAMQDARLKREVAIGELKLATAKEKQARNRSDVMSRYEREYTRLMALERAWMARAVAPGDLDAQAAKMESQAWFEQQKLPLVAGYRGELVQARARAEQMAFQKGMQASAQAFQSAERQARERFEAGEKALDRQLQRDLAQISVSAKAPRFDAKGRPLDKDGMPAVIVPPSGVQADKTTGAILVGPDGKPVRGSGEIWFDKTQGKNAEKFGEITTGANRQFKTLTRLHELLGDQNRLSAIAMGTTDAELTALLTQLGTEGAKEDDPGGRYTDRDFSRGITGKLGFDPNGKTLDRFKFAESVGEVRDYIKKLRDELPNRVNQAIAPLNDTALNGEGTRVVWAPVDLDAPKVEERSENQVTGSANVKLTDRPVKDSADYRARLSTEAGDPARVGQELPEHEHDKVEAVMAAAKGRGPDAVTKEAQRILRDLDARAAKLTEGSDLLTEGRNTLAPDVERRLRSINATRDIVKSVAFDEVQKAKETLDKFEKWAKWATSRGMSDETKREQAKKRFGLTGAPREVDEAIRRAQTITPEDLYK